MTSILSIIYLSRTLNAVLVKPSLDVVQDNSDILVISTYVSNSSNRNVLSYFIY